MHAGCSFCTEIGGGQGPLLDPSLRYCTGLLKAKEVQEVNQKRTIILTFPVKLDFKEMSYNLTEQTL